LVVNVRLPSRIVFLTLSHYVVALAGLERRTATMQKGFLKGFQCFGPKSWKHYVRPQPIYDIV